LDIELENLRSGESSTRPRRRGGRSTSVWDRDSGQLRDQGWMLGLYNRFRRSCVYGMWRCIARPCQRCRCCGDCRAPSETAAPSRRSVGCDARQQAHRGGRKTVELVAMRALPVTVIGPAPDGRLWCCAGETL